MAMTRAMNISATSPPFSRTCSPGTWGESPATGAKNSFASCRTRTPTQPGQLPKPCGVEAARLPNETVTPPWVTISIGVATLLHGDPGLPGLLKQDDVQLYRAKQQGRNRGCTTIIGK